MSKDIFSMLNYLFNAYKYFVYSLKYGNSQRSTYRILISKVKSKDGLTKVSISIMDIKNKSIEQVNSKIVGNNFYNFAHHIILPDEIASKFIYRIIMDFNEEKLDGFSSINIIDKVLTVRDLDPNFERSDFELQIKLNGPKELVEAQEWLVELNKNDQKKYII